MQTILFSGLSSSLNLTVFCNIISIKCRERFSYLEQWLSHYFVNTRTMFKNKVHVELSKRWIDYSTDNSSNSDLFTQKGREYLRSLKIPGVKVCLDTIDFLSPEQCMP